MNIMHCRIAVVGAALRAGASVLLVALLVAPPSAWSLTILRDFTGGTPSPNMVGGGNLPDIFNAAADTWERTILDDHVLTLHFGWGAPAEVASATHQLLAQGGVPNRETEGRIIFDSATILLWFMDPTPALSEEWATFTEVADDLGGGSINTGRVFSDPVGLPPPPPELPGFAVHDLFSVALHEIGHALGLSNGNSSFLAENADGDIDVTAPRPFAGTTIPLQTNNFGVTSHFDVSGGAVMAGGAGPGRRVLPSALDILAMAELSEFDNIDLDPFAVPEPSSLVLLTAALLGLVGMRQRAGRLRARRRRQ